MAEADGLEVAAGGAVPPLPERPVPRLREAAPRLPLLLERAGDDREVAARGLLAIGRDRERTERRRVVPLSVVPAPEGEEAGADGAGGDAGGTSDGASPAAGDPG